MKARGKVSTAKTRPSARVSAIVTLRLRSGAQSFKLIVAPDRDALLREARHQGYMSDAVTVAVANGKNVTVYVRGENTKFIERAERRERAKGESHGKI